jgi:methionyl-tRNA formyltransferase
MAHQADGIVVATGDGAILITQAQLPGKKRLPLSEMLHAPHPLFAVGKTLG